MLANIKKTKTKGMFIRNNPTSCLFCHKWDSSRLNKFLKDFDFNLDKGGDHYLNEEKKSFLEKKNLKSKLTCKKGDLALIDLKTAHYGTLPEKGQRHLLWLYY